MPIDVVQQDRRFMVQALRLAARAEGRTCPNPLVGCVVVRDGRRVGTGYHRRAGEAHAEVEALNQAGDLARGATAYVTLEPCSHFGRTPPCADALIDAGVQRVVTAMQDPNPLVAGRGLQRLREAGIEVVLGVEKAAATRLNAPFLTWMTQKRPMITIKGAVSLDGKIATRTGKSQWITGKDARLMVQRLRDRHDVVMVGSGTVLADNPLLTCRLPRGRNPVRLVLDSTLRVSTDAALFSVSPPAPLWIATTPRADPLRMQELGTLPGVEILTCRANQEGRVDLHDLMGILAQKGILSILSEAGGILTHALLEARLADRLALFMAPLLIGGREAPGFLDRLGIDRLTAAPGLEHMQVQQVGKDLLLTGDLRYPDQPK
ncbi:MAG: bifunctional diaminohydroxyphosphoribosylaminopyrimidine deaminase/5-amino-6-(5-phosphoribosylamino)uracil reductase RibD [Magnetococcales bacterium]|nr:bifunctional diaminohydroxyphosphoribosylaminopyrimidine deaminase/5-amino-6-(5-phosphoribosylamino)uracil reductase RibD [Magnetococcales bacterium]